MTDPAATLTSKTVRVYLGTYTETDQPGIYFGCLDLVTGRLKITGSVTTLGNPSFLCLESQHRYLYAVHEIDDFQGEATGAVSAFQLDPIDGRPLYLNSRASGGPEPCHLSVDAASRFLFIANYKNGSVALLSLQPDGRLGETCAVAAHHGSSVDPERQKGPHAHAILPDPQGQFVLATDLGTDKIMLYDLDADNQRLPSHEPPFVSAQAGSGPRHLTFHPNGRILYVIHELTSTVSVWELERAQGALAEIQSLSSLPPGFTGDSSGMEVQVSPAGRFVYASNSGHDSIAVFAVDPETDRLTPPYHVPSGGRGPRHFAIDPTGTYLLAANQHSGTIVTFRIDPATGNLTPTGDPVGAPCPVCVQMLSAG